ncbi:HAD-IA family hydrolase [Elizabethkingia argentiflava]|uniref:HAD-IA family hydrolase n=1 Tax=Elizabethkingia argenteiflava TaxID=2681556 RepID=A0A845PU70_9FLAO|nr:HAD-IA family hydrolase [Elizabethkingia argenteiflava]
MIINKYILWDLDGTIVNSEDLIFKKLIFSSACEQLGLDFNLQENAYAGNTVKEIFALLLQSNHVSDDSPVRSAFDLWKGHVLSAVSENILSVKPRSNAVELWQQCHKLGIQQAVVTSNHQEIAIQYLRNAGLYDMCVSLTCMEDVRHPKPDPEPYLLAMSKLNSSPASCIAIEDSITGIRSAKAAGLYTLAWVKDMDDVSFGIADVVTAKLSVVDIVRGLGLDMHQP